MRLAILTVVALLAAIPPTAAQDASGCDRFAWPLTRERAWLSVAGKTEYKSGDTIASLPNAAVVLRLDPADRVKFVQPPERNPGTGTGFGGVLHFPAPAKPGIYQVTLSTEAWIDIVQDGHYVRSVGSSGRRDCPGMRKSVRLELGTAAFVLQLSNATSDSIALVASPLE